MEVASVLFCIKVYISLLTTTNQDLISHSVVFCDRLECFAGVGDQKTKKPEVL